MLQKRDGLPCPPLPPVNSSQEYLGIVSVLTSFLRHHLQRTDSAFAITMKAGEESKHLVSERKAADQIIVYSERQARIDIIRIDLDNFVVKLTCSCYIAQSILPCLADQKVIIRLQPVRKTQCIQRLGISWVLGYLRL